MDVEIPILTGYLTIKSQSGFSIAVNKISKKKSTNLKYCLLFKASRHGIERLEICDNESDKNPRIVTLENCIKITHEPTPANLISIITKTGQIVLNTQDEDELKKWTRALQMVCFAFKDKMTTNNNNRNSMIEADNDLYCSSYSEGVFPVTLIPSETTVRCKLDPKTYTLALTSTEMLLKDFKDDSLMVAKWPYRFIRKYGYRDGKFTFEAGRKCETGEGVFRLDHSNPQEIFRCMSARMKSMKQLMKGESLATLDCGEAQFSAALSMEAGSRSPLPPSPNNQKSTEIDLALNQSHASLRGFVSSTDSLNNNSASTVPLLLKTIPAKPPRKTLLMINVDEKPPEMPPTVTVTADERDYERIEQITDAWKTLGIDDVRHTERPSSPGEEELAEFVWQRTSSRRGEVNNDGSAPKTSSSPMDSSDTESTTYDRLDFLRSSRHKVSSGYKTVVPIVPPPPKKTQISDDYEVIGTPDVPDTQPCRLADDSYLGYGVLRKLPTPSPSAAATPNSPKLIEDDCMLNHHQYNGLDYAIVSKPKRV